MGKVTLTLIKPTAVKNNHIGEVIKRINKDGNFRIAAMKMLKMRRGQAKEFYKIHQNKPFYDELVEFMTSGPIVAMVLEKNNAVEEFRKFIGSTDPQTAEDGTLRHTYGVSVQENCVHGSDSDQNALKEIKFFFSVSEIFDKNGNIMSL